MPGHVLFLTGTLALPRLHRTLDAMAPLPFATTVVDIGVKVAALMTTEIISRRLGSAGDAELVLLPGRFRGDPERLGAQFGVRFERGPEDLADLPEFFGRRSRGVELSGHDCRIFAEIIDAPQCSVEAILAKAAALAADGAEVIDLGCLPDLAFPHLEETVQALRCAGHGVSIDSADPAELRRGAAAGAQYVLSLTEDSLSLADEIDATPVVIPSRPGDLPSLYRAIETLAAKGRRCLADPILDPIHFGFTASLVRYAALRDRFPDQDMLMGIGNVTELTDADTTGITATLMGVVSELAIRNVLAVQVSPHCRRAVREFDAARRQFFAARAQGAAPQRFGAGLLCLRDRRPFPTTPDEIAALAAQVRDANYRIEVAEDGIHLYNRDGHHVAADAMSLYPVLTLDGDTGHAFYLGAELARAEVAWQLGKRYVQDGGLDWGVAADRPPGRDRDPGTSHGFAAAGPTRRPPQPD